MSDFQQPGVADPENKFVAAEHNGALLLVFPKRFHEQIKTSNGETDAVDCKIVNLNTGRVLSDARVFGSALIPQLKAAVPDGMVLGVLGQGENKKGNPPWLLFPHTEEHVRVAEAWLAQDRQNQFAQAQPQGPTGAPAQGGWGQQAPAPAPAYGAPATGGWGNPPAAAPAPAQGGWGAPASAPASPAPAAAGNGGWGQQAPAEQGQFAGQWGNAAPAPAIDPGLLQALQARGVDPSQLQNQAHAEQIAAAMGLMRG